MIMFILLASTFVSMLMMAIVVDDIWSRRYWKWNTEQKCRR
jgi:hypothetical protein